MKISWLKYAGLKVRTKIPNEIESLILGAKLPMEMKLWDKIFEVKNIPSNYKSKANIVTTYNTKSQA